MGLLLQIQPGLQEPARLWRHLGMCRAGGCECHGAQQRGQEEGLPGCRSTMGWGDPRHLTPPASELLQGLLWAKPSLKPQREEVMADADPGLQSAELTSAQDREGQRVNLEAGAGGGRGRPGRQNSQHRWWQFCASQGGPKRCHMCFAS